MTRIMPRVTGARSGRTVLAGMSTAVSWAFAGLVLACVFVATAGARESLGFRTRALQQAVAAGPVTQNAVQADADWTAFDEAVSASEPGPGYGIPGATAVPLTTDQITAAMSELASSLAATPLPLAGRSADWSSLGTAFNPVTGAPAANIGSPPRMEIMYRDALSRNSRLVSGRWPAAASASRASGPRALQVVVTRATAQRFGLRPGSRLEMVSGITLVVIVVTGIVQPAVPHSTFWSLEGVAAEPSLVTDRGGEPLYWLGAAFAGAGEVGDLQRTFPVRGMHLTWEFPLALGGVDADHAQALDDHLNRAVSQSASSTGGSGGRAGVPLGTVVLTSGLVTTLEGFLGTQAQVEAMLALLFTGLTVLGAVVLLLGARLLAESRSAELALMRARGASVWQLAALTLRGSAVMVLPAAAAGAAAAVASTPGAAAPLAWWLAGVTVLVAIAGPPLVVARRHRAVNLAAGRAADPAARRRAQARRWVAEGAVVTAAAGGLILLHQHGSSGGSDAYLSAAPVLVAAPATLVILRLYPVVLRGLLRLSGGRAGAASFVGLATAARAPVTTALPAFALVLALAMAAFGGIAGGAILRGEVAASWLATGADVRIDLGFETAGSAAIQRALAATPGVRRSAAVVVTEALQPGGTDVAVAAVDPIGYARLTADTPLGHFPPGVLARRSARAAAVPVLASPAAVAALRSDGSQLRLITGSVLQAKVTGTVSDTPAMPGVRAFVILPRWALRGGPPANLIVATGDGLDEKKLTAAVNRLAPSATISFRSDALAALTSAPLQHGTYVMFVAGIAAAGIFGAAVLLLSLAISARSRSLILALLSTVGLGRGQARLLVAAEAVPPILASMIGGAACAWALAPLTGPALDLSVFTGSAQPVTLHADLVALAVPATGAILLGLLVLTAHTVISAGRDMSSVLRWDG